MGMLDRYKKSGGMKELIKLLESSDDAKKEKLLQMIRAEDAAFSDQVEMRLLTWEKILSLNPDILAEIVSSVPAQFLARALVGAPEDFVKICEKCIKNFNEYKEAKQGAVDQPPNAGQISAARRKVLEEARKLEEGGSFKLIDEAALSKGPSFSSTPAAATSAAPKTQSSSVASGSVPKDTLPQDQNTPPPRSAFNIEDPPSGLGNEQLQLFIKKHLGV